MNPAGLPVGIYTTVHGRYKTIHQSLGLSDGSFGFSLKAGTDSQKPNDLPGKPVGFKEERITSVLVKSRTIR
jgi:hypothetical protein